MKKPMQKANGELRFQTSISDCHVSEKKRNKNQSQPQREGVTQEQHTEKQSLPKPLETEVLEMYTGLLRPQFLWTPSHWPWSSNYLGSNLLTGLWFLLNAPPVCLAEKALHSPCNTGSKAHLFKITF